MARLTKRKLLTVFKTARDIAEKCGVDESWVSRWGMDKPIPLVQELRLRHELMPEVNWKAVARARIARSEAA